MFVYMVDFLLRFDYNISIKERRKTMLTIIFILWLVFAVTCAVLADVYEREFFGFLLIMSLPFMFYVPFMVALF